VNVRTNTGVTPMHLAAVKSDLNCLEQLHQAGAEANVTDDIDRTPLYMCVANIGNPRCVTFLIKIGPAALKKTRGLLPRKIKNKK